MKEPLPTSTVSRPTAASTPLPRTVRDRPVGSRESRRTWRPLSVWPPRWGGRCAPPRLRQWQRRARGSLRRDTIYHLGDLWGAPRDRARLVEAEGVGLTYPFQIETALDEHQPAGRVGDRRRDRGLGGEDCRARAGRDEHDREGP